MTFSRANPLGWALYEELTSAQLNALDVDHAGAIDGVAGGTWSPSDTIVINGTVRIKNLYTDASGNTILGNLTVQNTATFNGLAKALGSLQVGNAGEGNSLGHVLVSNVPSTFNHWVNIYGNLLVNNASVGGNSNISSLNVTLSATSLAVLAGAGGVLITSASNAVTIRAANGVALGGDDSHITQVQGMLSLLNPGVGSIVARATGAVPGSLSGRGELALDHSTLLLSHSTLALANSALTLDDGSQLELAANTQTPFKVTRVLRRAVSTAAAQFAYDANSDTPVATWWEKVSAGGSMTLRQKHSTWTGVGTNRKFHVAIPRHLDASGGDGCWGRLHSVGFRYKASGFAALPDAGNDWAVLVTTFKDAGSGNWTEVTRSFPFRPATVAALHASNLFLYTLTETEKNDLQLNNPDMSYSVAVYAGKWAVDPGASADFGVLAIVYELEESNWGY